MGESRDSKPGKRFSINIELVPIKKRRYFFQTTTPPQSPHEEPKKLEDGQSSSGDQAGPDSTLVTQTVENLSSKGSKSPGGIHHSGKDGKDMKASEGKNIYLEDVSSIAKYVPADFIGSQGNNTGNAARISYDKLVDKDSGPLKKSDNETEVGCMVESPDNTAKTLAESKASLTFRDDRLHWDLNTPMDEWVDPVDCRAAHYGLKVEATTVQSVEPKGHISTHNDECTLQPSIVAASSSSAQQNLTHRNCRTPQLKAEECSARPSISNQSDLSNANSTPSNTDMQINKISIPVMDTKPQKQVLAKVASVEHYLCTGQDENKPSSSDEGQQIATSSVLVEATKEGLTSILQVEKNESLEWPENGALLEAGSAKAAHDFDDISCEVIGKAEVRLTLRDNKNRLSESSSLALKPCPLDPAKEETKTLLDFSSIVKERVDDVDFKKAMGFSEVTGSNRAEVKLCNTSCQSTVSSSVDAPKSERGIFRAPDSLKGSGDVENTSGKHINEAKHENADMKHELNDAKAFHISSKAAADVGYSPVSVANEQSTKPALLKEAKGESVENSAADSCCNPVTSHSDYSLDPLLDNLLDHPTSPSPFHGARKQFSTSTGLEGELDSHLEDGELRDTGHCWEYSSSKAAANHHNDSCNRAVDNIIGGDDASAMVKNPVKGEATIQTCLSDYLDSKVVHPVMEKRMEENVASCDKGSCLTDGNTVAESFERKSSASNFGDVDNPEVVDMDVDDGIEFGVVCDEHSKGKVDSLEDAGDFVVNDVSMKSSGIEPRSQIKGSFPLGEMGTNSAPRSRPGYFDYGYHRDPMCTGVEESVGRTRSMRRDGEQHFSGQSWNRGLKSVVASVEGYDSRFFRTDDAPPRLNRHARFPTSRVGYTHLGKRGLPPEDACNRRNHGKSCSRSRTHSPDIRPEVGTGRQRTLYQPSNNIENSRRSPVRAYYPGRRVSTVGSPVRFRLDDSVRPVMLPVRFSGRANEYEDGNDYTRKPYFPLSHRRSRSRSVSPKFRAEVRMQTTRLPYRTSQTRERRSPVRVFHTNQRLDTISSSSGRLRTDDNYSRHTVRPGRFQDTSYLDRRNEFASDDYRRKPRNIFERIQSVRNYD